MQQAKTEAQAKARELWQARKQEKLDSAQRRLSDRAQRSPEQQLALLDQRLGEGVGAKRERARLQSLIEAPKPEKKKKIKKKKQQK
jgi:hypothetical protein